jgi:hypothetical protein
MSKRFMTLLLFAPRANTTLYMCTPESRRSQEESDGKSRICDVFPNVLRLSAEGSNVAIQLTLPGCVVPLKREFGE